MKHFEEPAISVEELDVVDVITTSPEPGEDDWNMGEF